ncbi:hypothetical protein DL765_006912 [Monosporascus sp. GIB2]|nr:hypothetical protein DL765_006912 [Monosporascus sp. GIB2]
MLATGHDPEQASEYFRGHEDEIKIAAINSSGSVTLFREVDAIVKLSAVLSANGVFNRLLKTGGTAYHSHHMIPLGSDYSKMLAGGLERVMELGLSDERQRYPRISWASSVTPDKGQSDLTVTASYLRVSLESPGRFSKAVLNLVSSESHPIDVLVKIGPHGALKSPLDQIFKSLGKSIPSASSLRRKEDGRISLLHLAGTLFGLNAEIELAYTNAVDEPRGTGLNLVHGCTAIDLPPYQYTYGPIPFSLLLHICLAIVAASEAYYWFPEPLRITGYSLRNVAIKTALKIPEDDYGVDIILSMELVDTATAKLPTWSSFSVSSVVRDSNEWTEHCAGFVKVKPPSPKK